MNRRSFLKNGSLLLSFVSAGQSLFLSPAAASKQGIVLQYFSKKLAMTAEILAEAIVPGAKQAGLIHYLDHQLSQPNDADNLLFIRYLGVPAPYQSFYQRSLEAAQTAAKATFGCDLSKLSTNELAQFVTLMMTDKFAQWQGPPSSFFYFVFRSDAVDVTYGTQHGFKELNIDYFAHINPKTSW